jgi:hypothetical protein
MKYQIDSEYILIELDRSAIVDISPGDELESSNLEARYTWSEQDAQFMESNPDAKIFLKFEKASEGFKGSGVVVVGQEVY